MRHNFIQVLLSLLLLFLFSLALRRLVNVIHQELLFRFHCVVRVAGFFLRTCETTFLQLHLKCLLRPPGLFSPPRLLPSLISQLAQPQGFLPFHLGLVLTILNYLKKNFRVILGLHLFLLSFPFLQFFKLFLKLLF